MNLVVFLAHILDTVPDVPVMAAGGTASGRTLAGVLAGGAEGARIGTALLATPKPSKSRMDTSCGSSAAMSVAASQGTESELAGISG